MRLKRVKKSDQRIVCIVIFLALWFLFVKLTQLPSFILPGPVLVLKTGFANAHLLLTHAKFTIIETLLGLFIGVLLGVMSALSIFSCRILRSFFHPLLLMSQALPTFVIAPLLVIWFGYGIESKIATTVLMLYFPITSTCYDGLVQCPRRWLDLANTMTQSKWRILRYIQLPAALPSFASGLRIATAVAPIGAVIGEWVGSSHGLGFLMLTANARMQIPLLFSCLLLVVLWSLFLYGMVDSGIKRLFPWIEEAAT